MDQLSLEEVPKKQSSVQDILRGMQAMRDESLRLWGLDSEGNKVLTDYRKHKWKTGYKFFTTVELIGTTAGISRSTFLQKKYEQERFRIIIKCTDKKGYMIHPRQFKDLKKRFTPQNKV